MGVPGHWTWVALSRMAPFLPPYWSVAAGLFTPRPALEALRLLDSLAPFPSQTPGFTASSARRTGLLARSGSVGRLGASCSILRSELARLDSSVLLMGAGWGEGEGRVRLREGRGVFVREDREGGSE